jgi:solute carrier family 25 (mitochondrial folate transporter), member 32
MAILRDLIRNPHPIASLYRGLTPNLIGNASSWASFFFFKSRIERVMARYKGAELKPSSTSHTRLTASDYFISSGLAGLLTQVITNPVWVLKTRMISSDRTSHGAYPSMWTGTCRLFREEGLRGFYRGLGVSLLGVSHGAVQFAVYDPLKRMYFSRKKQQKGQTEEHMSTEATIAISSAAKAVAGAVTYPYQVLRSRLQNYNADERFGHGIRDVVRRTYREEGLRGFYRGLTTGVVRVLPATWVTFLVYENVKFHLPRRWAG